MTEPNRSPADLSDEEIAVELLTLAAADEELRAMRRHFRADAHGALEALPGAALVLLDRRLDEFVYPLAHSGGTPIFPPVADLLAVLDPRVLERAHAAVDRASATAEPGSAFAQLDRPEWEARRAAINERATALEREGTLRSAQRRAAEAESQYRAALAGGKE